MDKIIRKRIKPSKDEQFCYFVHYKRSIRQESQVSLAILVMMEKKMEHKEVQQQKKGCRKTDNCSNAKF
jgi:hypothetical protein